MNKDAYYFPHFSNARHDRRIKRVRKELGIEGYAIYFMTLEVLRDQEDLAYPLSDLDLLADEFGTSEQKIEVVVKNYGLFQIDDDKFFFSPKLIEYLQPYFERSKKAKKAAMARWGKKNDAQALPEHSASNASKVEYSKEKKSNYVRFVDFWNDINGCSLRMTDKKRTQIKARLDTFSEDEIFTSIKNRSRDDWINGDGEKFKTDWNSFWRNDEKVERYLNKKQQKVMDGGTW